MSLVAEPALKEQLSLLKFRPEDLGDPSFRSEHGLKYAYVTGAMANGIASCEIVEAISKMGGLGFFGAAGLPPARVEQAIDRLQANLGVNPWGINLIHSPNEPDLEAAVADLFIRKGVRLVEASAYLDLTLPIVRYRYHGITPAGCPNKVIAKVSRVEVAEKFMKPAPSAMIRELVSRGDLTQEQARLAETVPVAQDVTGEADSGGHTDNRPLVTLLPTLIALRDRLGAKVRVGAAGGISTPASAAAAYLMGAAYVVTGSVNQSCRESGSSDEVRKMLCEAGQADVAMAPAADMFEMGVKVQILKRGTMFAMRAAKLYELYRAHDSLETLPAPARAQLERDYFRAPLEEIWAQTRAFFDKRDPEQNRRADAEPKHKMALVFRWYLGQASRWANAGEPTRKVDYQVWCGPAMGAFNEWAKGSFLEKPENRHVDLVALNLMAGAAHITRSYFLRTQGVAASTDFRPKTLEELKEIL
jgi:PfaD family protein